MPPKDTTVTVTVQTPGLDETIAKLERVRELSLEVAALGFAPVSIDVTRE